MAFSPAFTRRGHFGLRWEQLSIEIHRVGRAGRAEHRWRSRKATYVLIRILSTHTSIAGISSKVLHDPGVVEATAGLLLLQT